MDNPSIKNEDRQPAYYSFQLPSNGAASYYPALQNEEVTILDYWRVFKKRIWQIVIVTFLITGLAVAISFVLQKKYLAKATLMPLSSGGGGGLSGLASQLSSVPLVGGQLGSLGGALGGGKSKELVNILKSKTLSEKIINKFDLMKIIFAKQFDSQNNVYRPNWLGITPLFEDAVNIFQKKIANIEEEKKTGLIKIEIKLKDPDLAAKIANQMVLDLQDFINNNSLTISKRNRIFIEGQLVKNGEKLLLSGKGLTNFYAQNKISSILPQIDVNVGSYESVPEPLQGFQDQIDDSQGLNKNSGQKKEQALVSNVPGQIYLQYLTLNRELIGKSHALLTQQYELAKIEESKEDLAFQVIDKADVPQRAYFPKLILNMALGIVVGFFLAVLLAFFREYLQKIREKESHS